MSAQADATAPPDWDSVRACFPAAAACTYLNTAGGGPLSVGARAAALSYYQDMCARGDIGWPDWRRRVEQVRAQLARTLNARPEDVAFCGNASTGLNIAAALAPPGEVVTATNEFPSVTVPWIARRRTIRFLEPEPGGVLTPDRVDAALTPRTAVVALSHVQYASGARLDVASVGALCRDRGVMFICDATQSVGAFPVDLTRIGASVLVFSGYKWACAGYGIAGLYVAPAYRAWAGPPVAGWRSAESPYDLAFRDPSFSRDARALEMGHPPVPGIFALGGALEVTESIGIDRVAARIQELVGLLHAGLDELGLAPASPRAVDARSGIVMIPVVDADEAGEALKRKDIVVSVRGGKLRVSLHMFNSPADVRRLLAGLAAFR